MGIKRINYNELGKPSFPHRFRLVHVSPVEVQTVHLHVVPFLEPIHRPVDRLLDVAQITRIRVIGFQHLAVSWRKYAVCPDDVLQPLVDPRHMTFQAAVAG